MCNMDTHCQRAIWIGQQITDHMLRELCESWKPHLDAVECNEHLCICVSHLHFKAQVHNGAWASSILAYSL